MFEISVEMHFFADHQLALPDGSTEPSHSHDWVVTASVSSEKLNNIGIVMNFHKLRELLENIIAELGGKNLNKMKYFKENNPSAENVAKYIFEKLEPELPKKVKLEYISVIEEPLCTAKYSRQ